MVKFIKVLLGIVLMCVFNNTYAQSDIPIVSVPLETSDNDYIYDFDEKGKRDLNIYEILPVVFYHPLNYNFTIISPHVTFDFVPYYITDESGLVMQAGEMILPKGVEVEIPLSKLSAGSYKIVLDIAGICFDGEFEIE